MATSDEREGSLALTSVARNLVEVARIPTSGARAIEPFQIEDTQYLAIPQLALDVEGASPDMNGGNSTDLTLLILRSGERATIPAFEEVQRLSVGGAEDAEFFQIGERAFLAVASIRAGNGPYDFKQPQRIYEWAGGRFTDFQVIDGYAAKQWRHFCVGQRHFLGLAQGVAQPGTKTDSQPSRIYEWDGEQFGLFQEVDSAWGYNWHALEITGEHYLAYADHIRPSLLMHWNGERFATIQELTDDGGRAFADFERDGERYLVVARLTGPSLLLRWTGSSFAEQQTLEGEAGRELAVIEAGDELYVLRVNFISGPPEAPITALNSFLYQWQGGRLTATETLATSGGTDVVSWTDPVHGQLVAVSNSLTPDVRFATDSVIYRFVP